MCGFFIFFLILVHPIYISTSEIIIVDNIAKVKIKIFRDDLEDGLRLFHKKSISIDNKIKLKKASDRIDSYIKNKEFICIYKHCASFRIRVTYSFYTPNNRV